MNDHRAASEWDNASGLAITTGAVGTVFTHLQNRSQETAARTPEEIDALIAKYITGVAPKISWQYGESGFRFETLDDALESLRDPVMREYLPECDQGTALIEEVHEYPAYSSDLGQTSRVIDALGHMGLTLAFSAAGWMAQFGTYSPITASSAPLAVCLAALRTRGVA